MLEDIVIIGIVMGIVELAKSRGLSKQVVPFLVLGLAGTLNVVNAALFAPGTAWQEALKAGLTLGAIAGGLYGLGKAAVGRS